MAVYFLYTAAIEFSASVNSVADMSASSGLASSGFSYPDMGINSGCEEENEDADSHRALQNPLKRRRLLVPGNAEAGSSHGVASSGEDEDYGVSGPHGSFEAEDASRDGIGTMPSGSPDGTSSRHETTDPDASIPSTSAAQSIDVDQANREYLLAVHGIIRSRDLDKELEVRRMADFLTCVERGNLSKASIKTLLKTRAVSCLESYDSMIGYVHTRCRVQKRYALMCPAEHMAVGKNRQDYRCKSPLCTLKCSEANKYWYRYCSEMVLALCREEDSFRLLMAGCEAAHKAALDNEAEIMYDFYDGNLFRRKYARMMQKWDPSAALHVFLTFSSDGFEEFETRTGSRNAWPVAFIILNYSSHHRFKAGNAILCSFIPGSHDATHFDSFLEEIVQDLRAASIHGFDVVCADGIERKVFIHVLYGTFDYPGASKCMGFCGHNAYLFCRGCHKKLSQVPESGGRYAVPSGTVRARKAAIKGNKNKPPLEWIVKEKPRPRSDAETRAVWRRMQGISSTSEREKKREFERIKKATGISRVPVLGKLSLDFAHSLPYDPMYLLFLGWVKLTVKLLIGSHPKTNASTPYVVRTDVLQTMNASLREGFVGVPACWGRRPESFDSLSSFKAEDFKTCGMFFCPILFSGSNMEKGTAKLWGSISDVVHICCDPTPNRSEVEELTSVIQRAHALFTELFFVDDSYAFYFTPNTHAILHLPEMLAECGPLTNVSQFVVERLVGEIGKLVSSMVRPETNLFNKTHTLFGLRLLNGGTCAHHEPEDMEEQGEEELEAGQQSLFETEKAPGSESEYHFLGRGIANSNDSSAGQEALQYVLDNLGPAASNVSICKVLSFKRCRIGTEGKECDIETQEHFETRHERYPRSARQKFWISGVFEENVAQGETIARSYYGRVTALWSIDALFRRPHEQVTWKRTFALAKINWQYGMSINKNTGMVSVRKGRGETIGSVRHIRTSVEGLQCVDRLIGYFYHSGRRYFMDTQRRGLQTRQEIGLGGTL